MKIFNSLDTDFDPSRGCVLAVGNFDGVHLGHQLIFRTAVERAREKGLDAVLLTFSSHPASVLRPDETPRPLMTIPDRLLIAESFGFDAAFVLDFDTRMAFLPAAEFVEEVLVGRLGTRAVVAGDSWRFGYRRQGDMTMLSSMGLERGFEVEAAEPFMVDDLPVSSTRVRGALAAGDVTEAARLLGRPHFVRGTVVSGEGRGRKLGFPTVNLDCEDILVPGEGVYAGGYHAQARKGGPGKKAVPSLETAMSFTGPAAISIGYAPTFADSSFAVEAHLVGLDVDLYGQTVTIVFFERLRDQRAFAGPGDLAEQIALDVEKTRDLFSDRELGGVPLGTLRTKGSG